MLRGSEGMHFIIHIYSQNKINTNIRKFNDTVMITNILNYRNNIVFLNRYTNVNV